MEQTKKTAKATKTTKATTKKSTVAKPKKTTSTKATTKKTTTKKVAAKVATKKQPKVVETKPIVETFPESEVVQNELEFLSAIARLPKNLFELTQKAMRHYKVSGSQFSQLRKTLDILKDLVGHYNYVIVDLTSGKEKVELTDATFTKVFKNKSCGTWKHIMNDENIYVYQF